MSTGSRNGRRKAPIIRRLSSGNSVASGTTFGAQSELPRLPIPSLEETLDKFVKVLEALQTESQQRATKKLVEAFKNGDGPKLQNLLVKYEAEGRASGLLGSYVEEFWNDSYLAPDQSVVLNLNPFFVLEDGPDPVKDQIHRAASICFASVKLASLLKHETLPPDVFRGRPLCMDQFKALFGSTRVPQEDDKDLVHVYPDTNHVAVLVHNQMFYFQALWPDGTVAVDEGDIRDIIRAIQSHSAAHQEDHAVTPIGVLTSLPRTEWACARAELIQNNVSNEEALQIIDSALFVLVLDDYVPKSVDDAAAQMLHGTYDLKRRDGMDYQAGTCCNRWYDKLQIIVCGDGTTGVNFEHSAIDGHTALRFVSDIFAETVVNFAQSITASIHGQVSIPHVVNAPVKRAAAKLDKTGQPELDVFPKKILFDLPHCVKERIFFAETALADQIVQSEMAVLEFTDYGKRLIVGNKMSPDSIVQMSILLAYYKLYGKVVCTYEPVLTKAFYHGRTEAMRSATPQAKELCLLWRNPEVTKLEKLEALVAATKEHSRLVRESAAGKGVDRHLFALMSIAKRNGLKTDPFFKSDPWKTLNHTILSTSNCGNPSLRLFGFGPVVQDGFGIGYIIKDFGLHFSISSKHRQTKRFVHTLRNTLKEFQDIMSPLSSIQVADHRHTLRELPIPEQEHVEVESYDLWGENEAIQEAPPPKSPSALSLSNREDSESSADVKQDSQLFAHVVRRSSSVKLRDLPKIGVSAWDLSFDFIDENEGWGS